MSTDHPGRPFRYGIRFKIAVSIGVIMIALMAVDILWNLSLQNAQAENEAREKAEVLAAEMRAAWDFVDMNQEVINRAEDGAFRTKHLVCVVAAKSISMLFTTETDYSIRFTNDTPRQAANAPDEFEQEALAAFNADPERKAFWRVVDAGDGTRVFRYTEPLYVTESCLECHGDPVGELDQYGYPKEGMQVGQVGGAMSTAGLNNCGGEGTLAALDSWFATQGMLSVHPRTAGAPLSGGVVATGFAGLDETGQPRWRSVKADEIGFALARQLGREAACLAVRLA